MTSANTASGKLRIEMVGVRMVRRFARVTRPWWHPSRFKPRRFDAIRDLRKIILVQHFEKKKKFRPVPSHCPHKKNPLFTIPRNDMKAESEDRHGGCCHCLSPGLRTHRMPANSATVDALRNTTFFLTGTIVSYQSPTSSISSSSPMSSPPPPPQIPITWSSTLCDRYRRGPIPLVRGFAPTSGDTATYDA
jgi:hypothetical protein